MTNRRVLWILLLAATALRLVITARVPLVDDEAYYWVWSQRLAWGYADHPPAIGALIRVTTTLLGDGPLGVRAGPILLNLGTAWLLYDLGRAMFSPEVGALAALWLQTIPLFSIGAILSFPDAPFIFFWLLAMWALWRARGGGGLAYWILAGTAAGLAALSKVAALFLWIALAGYLVWGEKGVRWWRRPAPYVAAAIAIALVLPMLRWNAAHGDIMVRKARDPYVWVKTDVPALNALAYAGAQLAYFGPLTAALLVASLAAAWRGPRAVDQRYIYAVWLAIPLMGFFTALSFEGIAKPHWMAPGYLVALIPAAALWTGIRHRPWWRRVGKVTITVNLILIAALGGFGLWLGRPAAPERHAWPAFAERLQQVVNATPSAPGRFVLAPDYQTAAQIEYYLRGTVVATPFGFDGYEVWVPHRRLTGWNAVVLTTDQTPGLALERMFERAEALPALSVSGQNHQAFHVHRGLGFRGVVRR